MSYSVIITSAGSGSRLNLGYNKLLYKINDRILLSYTVEKFKSADEIIITSAENDIDYLKDYFKCDNRIKVILGGDTREKSVYEGVKVATNEIVLIHDGARFNVSDRLINDVIDSVINLSNNVIPVIKLMNDSNSRKIGDLTVQTPQGFKLGLLKDAFNQCAKEDNFNLFRDDSSLVYHYTKSPVTFVLGEESNFKVTTKDDLDRAINILHI